MADENINDIEKQIHDSFLKNYKIFLKKYTTPAVAMQKANEHFLATRHVLFAGSHISTPEHIRKTDKEDEISRIINTLFEKVIKKLKKVKEKNDAEVKKLQDSWKEIIKKLEEMK